MRANMDGVKRPVKASNTTEGHKLPGKVITIPAIELPTDIDVLFKGVDEAGRLLTDLERTVLQAALDHYDIDAAGPVWVLRPPDFENCFRFTERPDLSPAA